MSVKVSAIQRRRVIVFKNTAARRILRARENPHEHWPENTSGDALYWRPPSVLPFLLLCLGLRLPALPIDVDHRRRNAANKGIDFLRLRVKRKKKIREEFLTRFAQLPMTLE